MVYDVTREQLVAAMGIFDAKTRHVNWKNWSTNSHYSYAFEYNNLLYPIGHLLWMATRLRKSDSYWIVSLEKLGFKIVELQKNPSTFFHSSTFGTFKTEEEFEQVIIVPLLQNWGFIYQAQYPCRFHMGTLIYRGKIDFYISDDQGAVTLFEDKLRIRDSRDLNQACGQAKSYALMHGLASFVIAAPQGMWVYSLHKHIEHLEKAFSAKEIQKNTSDMKALLLKLRG